MLAITIPLTLLSLLGVILNIKKMRVCFFIWGITNAAWCVIDLIYGIYPQAVLFFVYFILAIWGIVAWRKRAEGTLNTMLLPCRSKLIESCLNTKDCKMRDKVDKCLGCLEK